jgi:ribosome-associated protein
VEPTGPTIFLGHKDTPPTMQRAANAGQTATATIDSTRSQPSSAALVEQIVRWLDEAKAESIVTIDIKKKSSIGDFMIIASGRSDRHVGAVADQVADKLKQSGYPRIRVEGQQQCDWVLVDAGDVIVHIFRPEVREFYNLEKMWLADRPDDAQSH